jgi:sugar-specific transcriptional regulator TrmB
MGPSTAQHLAAKAIVTRPTTYIVIESLTKQGLMSSVQRGKKKYFVAGKPAELARVIEAKKRDIAESDSALKKIVAMLDNAGGAGIKVPLVVYEGDDAMGLVREDLKVGTSDVLVLSPVDATADAESPVSALVRSGKGRKVKSLFAAEKGVKPETGKTGSAERRTLPIEKFPVKSEVIIGTDKAYISNPDSRRFAIHVQDRLVVETLRAMVSALWEAAK